MLEKLAQRERRAAEPISDELFALDEALRQFEIEEPEKARLVQLRYFARLSLSDAVDALGISLATAKDRRRGMVRVRITKPKCRKLWPC